MNKVYIITQGEYSDYHIVKVFDTREKAEEYTKLANTFNHIWGDYMIEEYEVNNTDVNLGMLQVFYDYYSNKITGCYFCETTDIDNYYNQQHRVINNPFCFFIPADSRYTDQNILLKIAQDKYAEYKGRLCEV